MTINSFIEKAIEGGWTCPRYWRYDHVHFSKILLDPEAWKAVGKVEGWVMHCYICKATEAEGHGSFCSKAGWSEVADKGHWRDNMHRMIDALAEGKTIEQYLETL